MSPARAKPRSLSIMKEPDKGDMAAVEALTRQCMDNTDYAEGLRAFMEKRKSSCTGH
jgi:hypothetical protein